MFIKGLYLQFKKTTYRIGKIFSNHISVKIFISRIYNNLLQLNNEDQQLN